MRVGTDDGGKAWIGLWMIDDKRKDIVGKNDSIMPWKKGGG